MIMEQKTYIVRCGEVALKGMNKPYFERMLVDRIRRSLKKIGSGIEVKRDEGLIFVRTPLELEEDVTLKAITKVFGVASVSPAVEINIEEGSAQQIMDKIGDAAVEYMMNIIEKRGIKTFKVDAKRANKQFPIQSPEIGRMIGARVLKGCKVLAVDVHDPDCKLFVSVRRGKAYVFEQKVSGFGGLPLGTNGKGMVLLSGGIDSPVAAFMMAKRGMMIEAIHFHSYPYTSERAWEKVQELASIVANYCGRFTIHSINLLPIQEAIVANCPEDEITILVRRFMMRLAERVAQETGCLMLITGENIGQVASQTAEALVVTDASVQMPVMRPLIAMDKVDIMDIAKEIGTYETSILPYEDCCTVFLPKHPSTKPKLPRILESESHLDVDALVEAALESRTSTVIYPQD
ncbi:MAG: tRNA 4-thiouridine(8) synthase ThiI [Firmicutes bacterium]|nr:tRNA 4-thiouridine(8) synthase ThiI [Bacillota bacterium]MBR2002160.1 tRNA 4-thiouridine(8) synthase ThiI [Bacillota bacterium]MBR4074070.1 tRNA 4-thiouridine(8) synthase ThiI [Bacillota bacterium]